MLGIRRLKLGSLEFPTNIIQGPLAGVSCAPFRFLTRKHGQPAFSCTEMISCKTLLHQSKTNQHRYVTKHPHEGPVCFQLAGHDTHELAAATKLVTDYGADLIDLNCGCPVKKIRSKGAGSSLLTQPKQLYALIRAMKENTHVPVSIKIRVQGGSSDKFNLEVAQVVSDAGADFLIVHGRHWTEHYETPCQHDEIAFFVQQLTIPVIGNGDIACTSSLAKMFATGCAGVMIARAGVGQPWLIEKLRREMQQETYTLPSAANISHMFAEHVEGLITLLGSEKFALLQARKLAKYYARALLRKHEFCEQMNRCETFPHFRSLLAEFF